MFRPQISGATHAITIVCLGCLWSQSLLAQQPVVHNHLRGNMPTGSARGVQPLRTEPLQGYIQPVQITAPGRVKIALAVDGTFLPAETGSVSAGMLIGAVYRLQVFNIPLYEGHEVYPTVKVINRLYPPVDKTHQFPVPVDLTLEELKLAIEGKFVTRVIYLEPPDGAHPYQKDPGYQKYFDVRAGDDPLEIADRLGRPMAILRIGGRLPEPEGPSASFLFHSPPLFFYQQLSSAGGLAPPNVDPWKNSAVYYPGPARKRGTWEKE